MVSGLQYVAVTERSTLTFFHGRHAQNWLWRVLSSRANYSDEIDVKFRYKSQHCVSFNIKQVDMMR